MVFKPRYQTLVFYGLSWAFVFWLYHVGAPSFMLVFAMIIQAINTYSVTLTPVQVSIHEGEIECNFPLRRATKRFPVAGTECTLVRNPLPFSSWSNFLVFHAGNSQTTVYRMGTREFDDLIERLIECKMKLRSR